MPKEAFSFRIYDVDIAKGFCKLNLLSFIAKIMVSEPIGKIMGHLDGNPLRPWLRDEINFVDRESIFFAIVDYEIEAEE